MLPLKYFYAYLASLSLLLHMKVIINVFFVVLLPICCGAQVYTDQSELSASVGLRSIQEVYSARDKKVIC